MPHLSPPRFHIEGGKFHLAEALFDSFKFKVRCPQCAGNPRDPGFIKDQGGKSGPNQERRRLWGCQRSNSRNTTSPRCGRVTCTEYINLASKQLDQAQFTSALERVIQTFPPDQE